MSTNVRRSDSNNDASAIAARLTPAMRGELMASGRMTRRPVGIWRALVRRGIAIERSTDQVYPATTFELTKLGQAVRDVLTQTN